MADTALALQPAAVFQTTGRREVKITGEEGASFALSKPSFRSWKCELVGRSKQDSDVMLLIEMPGRCGKKAAISDAEGQQLVELERVSYWGWKFIRRFTSEGREYQWKHSSCCWRGVSTFTLVEEKTKEALARRDLKEWSWERKGSITIFETGDHIPRALIIATALTTEKLWRAFNGSILGPLRRRSSTSRGGRSCKIV